MTNIPSSNRLQHDRFIRQLAKFAAAKCALWDVCIILSLDNIFLDELFFQALAHSNLKKKMNLFKFSNRHVPPHAVGRI
ncbi:hypothetical protein T12_6388 [Trichinella patagoniensis]|uniref:Uncharacterized protein n=1 Tax=Trichinella patagoniensis TaxID=990121 RepID=A0A0V0ZSS1_9BILA|nr:hypothetical protein T12_6388 [Trichinella patagoniensis]